MQGEFRFASFSDSLSLTQLSRQAWISYGFMQEASFCSKSECSRVCWNASPSSAPCKVSVGTHFLLHYVTSSIALWSWAAVQWLCALRQCKNSYFHQDFTSSNHKTGLRQKCLAKTDFVIMNCCNRESRMFMQ